MINKIFTVPEVFFEAELKKNKHTFSLRMLNLMMNEHMMLCSTIYLQHRL